MNRTIKIIFYCFMVLIVLEFGLRLWDTLTGNIITDDLRQLLYTDKATDNPFLEYTSKNNFDGMVEFIQWGGKFFVSTNSYGFRTRELFPKLPSTCRVVIMGDSFMYGQNVSQDGTVGVQLERLLRDRISPKIEVISLGVPSYSGVRYSVLADIYLDLLEPDILIVAVDQGDFEEDVERIENCVLRADGSPRYLKNAESLIADKDRRLVITAEGEIQSTDVPKASSRLRFVTGFSLYKKWQEFLSFFRDRPRHDQVPDVPPVTYESLVKRYGLKLPEQDFGWLNLDAILYDYETALQRYQPTFTCLKHIAKLCREKKIKLFLADYPYPWMVSIDQAVSYQYHHCKGQHYDFRGNRIHPRIMETFARELKVPLIDTYPAFERSKEKNYGEYDPHMNKNGYRLFATTVYQAIAHDVKQGCAGKK